MSAAMRAFVGEIDQDGLRRIVPEELVRDDATATNRLGMFRISVRACKSAVILHVLLWSLGALSA
jgi:hypothetical protein